MGLVDITALRAKQSTLRTERVDVPEWGGQVLLRELNGSQRMAMLGDAMDLFKVLERDTIPAGDDIAKAVRFAAKVVALTWIDEQGNLVVGPTDDELLLQQNYTLLMDLATKALVLSKMTVGAAEDAKKNLPPTATPDSGII